VDDITLLTIGLLVFAGVQVWLQYRSEQRRQSERQADRDEAIDRAFHLVWAEHFRLEGLSDHLSKADLIELALLDVLRANDVLPRDWGKVTESLAALSREAGFLGGVAVTSGHDLERHIAIYIGSVKTFAREAPPELTRAERIQWIRRNRGAALEPWEKSIRREVDQLAKLFWDVAAHNPRIALERRLDFSDHLSSDLAKAAVSAIAKRVLQPDRDPSSNQPKPRSG